MTEEQKTEEEVVEDEPAEVVATDESFTIEKGKERAVEAVDRVKQASKEITTRPILDAIGSYVYRGIDALIGLAEGMEGKKEKDLRKKDQG